MVYLPDARVILDVLSRTGVRLSPADARTLRRASITLRRWGERLCNGAVERDDSGDTPPLHFRVCESWNGSRFRCGRVPNPQPGALRRIAEVCNREGLHYFHQTDPRGCALYVAAEPMNASDYSARGVAIY
jgi:hypothetical protein